MVMTEVTVAVCKQMKTLAGADIRRLGQRWAAWQERRRRGEHERYFDGSADRFELERRERACTRWDTREGSLLGR